MRKFEFSDNGARLVRIDKRQARKLYDNGAEVLFVPCNVNPVNSWGLGIWETNNLWGQYKDFNTLVMWFEIYNCNSELGNYTAFYIKA